MGFFFSLVAGITPELLSNEKTIGTASHDAAEGGTSDPSEDGGKLS